MIRTILLTTFLALLTLLLYAQEHSANIRFTDAHELQVIGRYHDERSYERFPKRYEETLRPEVWDLGRNSAGISIRFRTNSRIITVRWALQSGNLALPHMPATGVSGVDLYGYTGKEWRYIDTGFPRDSVNEATLLSSGDGNAREYLLNLPLYNGVASLEIGVEASASLTRPQQPLLINQKPVVYYGTSIAQGACASRPGMAYTNILARKFDRAFINLGFSGNGTIETSVGEAMCEVNAALYVIDCNPNTKAELIYDRTLTLVKMLKVRRPDTPILLVERVTYETDPFTPRHIQETVAKKNAELKRAYETLKKSGVRDLHYLGGNGMWGQDQEGTVDTTHPSDVGMMRQAEVLARVIRKLL
jgi:hypothetical protein